MCYKNKLACPALSSSSKEQRKLDVRAFLSQVKPHETDALFLEDDVLLKFEKLDQASAEKIFHKNVVEGKTDEELLADNPNSIYVSSGYSMNGPMWNLARCNRETYPCKFHAALRDIINENETTSLEDIQERAKLAKDAITDTHGLFGKIFAKSDNKVSKYRAHQELLVHEHEAAAFASFLDERIPQNLLSDFSYYETEKLSSDPSLSGASYYLVANDTPIPLTSAVEKFINSTDVDVANLVNVADDLILSRGLTPSADSSKLIVSFLDRPNLMSKEHEKALRKYSLMLLLDGWIDLGIYWSCQEKKVENNEAS